MKIKILTISVMLLVIILLGLDMNTMRSIEIINTSSDFKYTIKEKNEIEKITKIFNNAVKESGIGDFIVPSPIIFNIHSFKTIETVNVYIYDDSDVVFFSYGSDTHTSYYLNNESVYYLKNVLKNHNIN